MGWSPSLECGNLFSSHPDLWGLELQANIWKALIPPFSALLYCLNNKIFPSVLHGTRMVLDDLPHECPDHQNQESFSQWLSLTEWEMASNYPVTMGNILYQVELL